MLTKEEKAVVARYLSAPETPLRLWSDMWPYLFPPAGFAVYGVWKNEIGAVAFAFAVLLSFVLWYLIAQHRASLHLQSAVRKYEDIVRALEKPAID